MITPLSKKEQLKFINAYKKEKKNLEKECKELWQKIIKLRANYKCEFQGCNRTSQTSQLHAHHIMTKGAFKHMRFDIDNGMCLCACHHNGFGSEKNSAHQDVNFKDKILGKMVGYKAIRTETWMTMLILRSQSKRKLDLNLEYLYLKQSYAILLLRKN